MMCERCHEKVATVRITEIVQQKKRELHLCEACARQGTATVTPSPVPSPKPVVKSPPAAMVRSSDPLSSISCPVCGMTFERFRTFGRLGCANDYVAFRAGLEPLLEKIHGAAEHRGRVPAQVSARLERRRLLAELREKLNRAIEREAYEEAVVLRDRIHELEEKERGRIA